MIKFLSSVVNAVLKVPVTVSIERKLPLLSVCSSNITLFRELGKTTRKRRRTQPKPIWPKRRSKLTFDFVTRENKEFIKNVAEDNYPKQTPSILKEEPWERGTWTPDSKRTGLICRKIGIYPMWSKTGKRFLTTLLQVVDNHVIKYHSPEIVAQNYPKLAKKNPGKGIMVIGAESANPEIVGNYYTSKTVSIFMYLVSCVERVGREVHFTGEYINLFNEAGVMPKRKLSRFFVTPDAALKPGTPLFASHFRPGDYVNVRGKTVGHGFQGVVKRWGFKGGPKTHGCTKSHRRPGNVGAGAGHRDNMWKGTKLPGHMGQEIRLLVGLKVLRINTKHNVIWVHGHAVPGHVHHYVFVNDCMIEKKRHKAENPPHFPTAFQDEWEEIPEEFFDEDLHRFADPSVTFENVK